jgi:hypothetical protein
MDNNEQASATGEYSDRLLEDYLSKFRERGQHDSEGFFTVAGTRAIGKLAEFLLPEKTDWLLKMVQAACLSGSAQLHIKQAHKSTQFQLQLPYKLDLDLFEKRLTSASVSGLEPGVADLIAGLRAVGVGQLRDWVASLTVGHEKAFVTCFEGQVTSERLHGESQAVEGTGVVVGVSYPHDQSGKIGGLIRFGEAVQNEHLALVQKTRACPIPLYLDGSRLDDLREPKLSNALRPRAFLGINVTSQPGNPRIRIPGALHAAESPAEAKEFHSQAPFLVPPLPGDREAGSIIRWYYNYGRREEPGKGHVFLQAIPTPSRVYLVRHGVVVGRRNMGVIHPISADVFISADHLRGDLTGLYIDPSTEEVEFAKEGLRLSADFLQEVLERLTRIQSRPFSKDLLLYGGLGALSLLSPWFALKAVTGTVSGIMIARAAKNDKRVLADCIAKLEEFRPRLSE